MNQTTEPSPPPAARSAETPRPALPDQPAAGQGGTRRWFVFVVTVLLGLIADLGSKELAFRYVADEPFRPNRVQVLHLLKKAPSEIMILVPRHESVTVIPGVLDFQLVLNAGAVFGAGQGKRWFFIGFTLVALSFAVVLLLRGTDRRDWLAHTAVGMVVSGGLGNLYDRLFYGCVRDFIHPLPGIKLPFGITWPHGSDEVWPYISNVADAVLLIGIGVLMVKLWRKG
ncbi:MAG: signal peptidase II [Phycisphaerales bacterium]